MVHRVRDFSRWFQMEQSKSTRRVLVLKKDRKLVGNSFQNFKIRLESLQRDTDFSRLRTYIFRISLLSTTDQTFPNILVPKVKIGSNQNSAESGNIVLIMENFHALMYPSVPTYGPRCNQSLKRNWTNHHCWYIKHWHHSYQLRMHIQCLYMWLEHHSCRMLKPHV